MANPDHLAKLKRGVEAWNEWRSETPDIQVDLSQEVLDKVNLGRANLSGVWFTGTSLSKSFLHGANLMGADLSDCDLSDADLSESRLIKARLDNALIDGVLLWESQRAGWSIKGIECDFVYWDEDGKEKSFYQPGEFERLFAEKTKIKLFYKDGINPLEIATLPALIKHLENSHPGCGLRLVSIHEDSGGVVVELGIEDESNYTPKQLKQLKKEVETTAKQAVEFERKFLGEEKQRLQLEGEVKQLTSFVDKLIFRPSHNIQGNYMGNTYNISGQAGAVGDNAQAHDNTFNQIADHLQSVDLDELAKQLGELQQAIAAKQADSPQAAIALGEVAKAEIAAQEKKLSKVVEHLKAAGQWTLDFAKEVGKDVVAEAIKQSMGMS